MTDFVYIHDFTEDDRDELLEYLWLTTKEVIDNKYEFNIEKAKMQINANGGYAHVICGRKIEFYIYNVNALDPYIYDFHNGCGTVQSLVNEIRQKKKAIQNEYGEYMQNDYVNNLFYNFNI